MFKRTCQSPGINRGYDNRKPFAMSRRFVGRQGAPSQIISDNAPQSKLGFSVIEEMWKDIRNSKDILSYFPNTHITWKVITEYAPWKGGDYERLIGLIKDSLRKAL